MSLRILERLCSRGTVQEQDKLLSTMVAVMMENKDNVVQELLQVLRSSLGGCTLSVVKISDRGVVATTEEDAVYALELSKVVYSIKDICKERYYLRNQKNQIWFREGCHCIRVVPLVYAESVKYSLVIEQEDNTYALSERAVGVLAIALHLQMLEQDAMCAYFMDSLTGLPNRDALERYLEDTEHVVDFVGMFYLRNSRDILVESNYEGLGRITRKVAALLIKEFPDMLYTIGDDKFAVCLKGNLYTSVSYMQDCMDKLMQEFSEVVFSAALIPLSVSKQLYKVIYSCEQACREARGDVVTVVRDVDVVQNDTREDVYMGGSYSEKETVVVHMEEVEVTVEAGEESCHDAVKEAEEDLEFLYHIEE